MFTSLMTAATYAVNIVLIVLPQSAYFLLHTVLGLSEELAQMGLMPLVIYSVSTFPGLLFCIFYLSSVAFFLAMKKFIALTE